MTGRSDSRSPKKILYSWIFAVILASLVSLASSASAQPPATEGSGESTLEKVETAAEEVPYAHGPTVAVPPARFAGWFQPWLVALLFGLPLVAAVVERRKDLGRWARRRDWHKRSGPE